MAVSFTKLDGGGFNGTATSSKTTASVSPTSGSLVLVAVYSAKALGGATSHNVSGLGLTWVQVAAPARFGSNSCFMSLWRAMGTVTPGVITLTANATQTDWAWTVIQADGTDTTGTNGSGAIVQSPTATGSSTTPSVTLAAFSSSRNVTFGFFAASSSSAITVTKGANFTQLDTESTDGTDKTMVEYELANDTAVNGSTTSAPWGIVGVEIKAGPATTSITPGGTVTSSGSLAKRANKPAAGAITPSGAIVKVGTKPLAGSMTPSGALVRRINKVLAGGITPSGALTKRISRALAGTVTSSGALVNGLIKILAVGGTILSSGALTLANTFSLAVAGTVTSAGSLAKFVSKGIAGTVSSSGSLARLVRKALGGSITPSGALSTLVTLPVKGLVTLALSLLHRAAGSNASRSAAAATDAARHAAATTDAARHAVSTSVSLPDDASLTDS